MKRVVLAALALGPVFLFCQRDRETTLAECRSNVRDRPPVEKAMFGGDRGRTGWNDREPILRPSSVAAGMTSVWTSDPFAHATIDGRDYAGRAYASPLYADHVRIAQGAATGDDLSVVFVATSNGDVYALAGFGADCTESSLRPGQILWRAHLVTPAVVPRLDSGAENPPKFPGIAVGTLATPAFDRAANVVYVTAMDAEGPSGLPVWKVFAIDAASGDVRPGWPVTLVRDAVESKNTNAPAYFDDDARYVSQRSALALSPSGDRLYVTFGGYWDEAVGWVVSVDTRAAAVAASFSGARDTMIKNGAIDRHANAGMWAPGGPAIDAEGRVYVTTGNSPVEDGPTRTPHAWGNAMLRLSRDLVLDAAYAPYDFCELDRRDVDISGSSPTLLPTTDGRDLVTLGGKAGIVYLLDRAALPRAADTRGPCATSFEDAARDASLLPPAPAEPYCDGFDADPCIEPRPSTRCVAGPLMVFGPPNDDASVDRAKMRTTPAFFRGADGAAFVYVAGSTKAKRCSPETAPPSVVRLRVVSSPTPHLAKDGADHELSFVNPGSPVVTSHEGRDPIVWVLDQNARRTHALLAPSTPAPILYAVDGTTMALLWKSAPSDLEPGGKYTTPLVAHGTVFVATDRLHAFEARR